MVKRDDSGSGLRAGFVRGDGVPKPTAKAEPAKKPEKKAAEKPKPAAKAPKKKEAEPIKGPTLTMQGVSGKKITGAVKVIKKTAAKPSDKDEKPKKDKPEMVDAADAAQKPDTADKPEKVKPAAAAKPIEAKDQQPKPADKPAAKTGPAKAPAVEKTGAKPMRPQSGFGRRPESERAPGQGGSFIKRPQSGFGQRPHNERAPGQGGSYSGRPQGSRPQGGRPQGGRPQGGRPQGQGTRPQGARPSGSARPSDGRVRSSEQPVFTNDAKPMRDRPTRRDDSKDNKRASLKPGFDNKDKNRNLKQQAQALSGQGVKAALSDDSVLDKLYREPKKGRGRGRRSRRPHPSSAPVVRAVLTHVKIPETLTVKEFSEAIKKTSAEVIKSLIKLGIMATLNQEIDFDTATIVAEEFGITTEKMVEVTEEEILFDDSDDEDAALQPRPPVVVVMGHVDHGKTSILDRIRSAAVVDGEAGGITQHIGAYTVDVNDRLITFLDTPGHEAFTTMRARGAQVTDIAILVVAADDGVMPQTIEAINHAKAAGTEVIVAINKIDVDGANVERVKQELTGHELIPEEWGGQTVMVPVSAKTGENMESLLEMVLLTADVLELKADPDKQAKGTIIEAKLDKNRGPVATVLVQRGTLKAGDSMVTGSIIGRIRAMTDDKGKPVKTAGPSIPVEILGLPEVPEAGEIFYAVTDEKVAKTLADRRRSQQREQQLRASSRMSLDTLFSQMSAGEVKDLNIVVKADVQGSVEAVRQSLEKIGNEEVRVKVIHGAVGAITESDIRLAEVSNAIVIGFNVRPAVNVSDIAEDAGVDIRMYRVIYNAIDDIEAAMKGMLAPKFEEKVQGHAEIRQVFKVSGVGSIGGCYVTDGKILRSNQVRIVRDGIVIHEGQLASLKRFKDDVREVAAGYECGLGIEKFNDIKENDVVEAFEMVEIERG